VPKKLLETSPNVRTFWGQDAIGAYLENEERKRNWS
jgi:hypothetical protein